MKHLDRFKVPTQDEIAASNLDGDACWRVMGFDYQTGPRFGQQLAAHRKLRVEWFGQQLAIRERCRDKLAELTHLTEEAGGYDER